jgi:hypothetical protein
MEKEYELFRGHNTESGQISRKSTGVNSMNVDLGEEDRTVGQNAGKEADKEYSLFLHKDTKGRRTNHQDNYIQRVNAGDGDVKGIQNRGTEVNPQYDLFFKKETEKTNGAGNYIQVHETDVGQDNGNARKNLKDMQSSGRSGVDQSDRNTQFQEDESGEELQENEGETAGRKTGKENDDSEEDTESAVEHGVIQHGETVGDDISSSNRVLLSTKDDQKQQNAKGDLVNKDKRSIRHSHVFSAHVAQCAKVRSSGMCLCHSGVRRQP